MAALSIGQKILGGASLVAVGAGVATAIAAGILPTATTNSDYNQNKLTSYPSNLPIINGETFCIIFPFYKYNRPSILVPPVLSPLGSIALPIPSDLMDQSSISYSEESLGLVVGAALEGINVKAGITEQNTVGTISGILSGISDQAALNAIGKLTGLPNAAKAALQMGGLAQNPFLTVLFNAPTFKRHIFTWTLIPENAQDSATLKYITNKFRFHSLPDIAGAGAGSLLTYPDMCIPKILPDGNLYDFKQCVVESMVINYAPGDVPAFFPTNAPNAVKLTLRLLEIEYWTKGDITSSKYSS